MKKLLLVAMSAVCAMGVMAEEEEDESIDPRALELVKVMKAGPITAKVGFVAEQKVDEGYAFIEAADTAKFLELSQNLPDDSVVGVILAKEWIATYRYNDIGYVSDEEKDSLDADAIFDSFKEGNEKENEERRRRGWSEMTLIGWACKPHYDEVTHNLEWAAKFSTENGVVINYNTRILGRGGVMSVTLVCEPEQLETVLPEFKSVLKGFTYTAGNRYFEFREGDRVAEVGLTALIVGGAATVAVKSGMFKWLWKVIVAIVVGIGATFKKIFGGDKDNQ